LDLSYKNQKIAGNDNLTNQIYRLDDHLVAAFTGLNADARVLVNNARVECQVYRLNYDSKPTINYISRHISKLMQKYTQKGGSRPFGFSLMLATCQVDPVTKDSTPLLYQIEPSGMITFYRANAIGKSFICFLTF
jgi:20S proteasome subunit alpha 4